MGNVVAVGGVGIPIDFDISIQTQRAGFIAIDSADRGPIVSDHDAVVDAERSRHHIMDVMTVGVE